MRKALPIVLTSLLLCSFAVPISYAAPGTKRQDAVSLRQKRMEKRKAVSEAAKKPMDTKLKPLKSYYESLPTTSPQEFPHLGLTIKKNTSGYYAIHLLSIGSAADLAGLMPEDELHEINGHTIDNRYSEEDVLRLLNDGSDGSNCTLKIGRANQGIKDITLVRQSPKALPAFSLVNQDNILIITITRFTSELTALRSEVEKALQAGANKIVIDLRGYPTGSVDGVKSLLALFIPAQTTILQAITSDTKAVSMRTDQSPVVDAKIGVAIMTNDGSPYLLPPVTDIIVRQIIKRRSHSFLITERNTFATKGYFTSMDDIYPNTLHLTDKTKELIKSWDLPDIDLIPPAAKSRVFRTLSGDTPLETAIKMLKQG